MNISYPLPEILRVARQKSESVLGFINDGKGKLLYFQDNTNPEFPVRYTPVEGHPDLYSVQRFDGRGNATGDAQIQDLEGHPASSRIEE